jgi:hypothetical protein
MPLKLIPPEEILVRKKAEEKPPKVPKVPKERKEPVRIPKMIVSEKERRAGVPIIPGDPCCAKICETLNDDIDRNRDVLQTTVALAGEKIYKSAIYRSLIYHIEALEEHRQDLRDQNGCGCIAETGAVSIIVPLIQARRAREGTLTRGIKFVTPSLKLKRTHLGEKSIIPPTNSCCPESCKILNKEIDLATKILDNMELRGGFEATKNPRYEALSSKASALQDYRTELKNKESCKCVE